MISEHLVGVALHQLVSGAASIARFSAGGGGDVGLGAVAPALKFLQAKFTDQSSRVTAAIESSSDRAWRALELVLAGDSLWDRLKSAMSPGDMKAFRHDVRGLLAAANVDGNYPVDRKAASQELRAARKAGLLQPTGLTPAGLAESVGVFARFDNPGELASAQWKAAGAVATDLTTQGYPALAAVVAFKPNGASLPLLGVAIRYFFRRAVEEDAELARSLTFAKLEGLAESQQNQFESLNRLMTEQADRLDEALGELLAEVAEVKAVALDIRAEQDRLGDQNRQIMEAILALQGKLDQTGRPAVRPQDSLSVRTDGERELVKKVIAQYRRLPESERADRPALQNAVGMLEVAAGEFAAAQSDFAAVAQSVDDPAAKGAAHLNAYRAALESRDWANALKELVSAIRCDGRRFAPFPVGKYVPQRILGAGGFGVAFLCKHKYMDAQVVVKTLSGSGPDQDFEAVFVEARAAAGIQHPGIVRVTDCGYADSATKDRPFVVMEYFPGQSLDEHVRENGPIAVGQFLPLARSLAEALGAAHAKGILHRDVKPGNVLVRRNEAEFEVRVIDFGLAVRHRAGPDVSTSRASKTLAGESIAGTIDYAAPEQMGRGNGAKVGPHSDVFGWAKSCCFALFQTPNPTLRHWQGIPKGLAGLLGRCLEEDPKERPASFTRVLAELDEINTPAKPTSTARSAVSARTDRNREDEEDDDDRPVRKRRPEREEVAERPRQSRKKSKAEGGFPLWVGGAIAAGLVAVIVLVALIGSRKQPTDPPVAGLQGTDSTPKSIKGGATPKGQDVADLEPKPKDTTPKQPSGPSNSVFKERQRYPIKNLGAVTAQFDLEGQSVIFTGADRNVVVLDPKTGNSRVIFQLGASPSPPLLAVMKDGKVGAASLGDKDMPVKDRNGTATGVITLPVLPPTNGSEDVDAIFRVSANGRFIALARRGRVPNPPNPARFETPFRLRDTNIGKDVFMTQVQGGSVWFNADSTRMLMVDTFGLVQQLRIPGGMPEVPWKPNPPGRPLTVLAASADLGALLCNGLVNDQPARFLMRGDTGDRIAVLSDKGLQTSYQLSADGKLVASIARSPDWILNLFDGTSGAELGSLKLPATNDANGSVVALSPDGRTAVVVDRKQSATAIVYDVDPMGGPPKP